MLDPQVRIDHVQTAVGFDQRTLLPSRQVQVTYFVGTHGPFTLVTPEDKFNQEYLEEKTGAVAATLRSAGAIPAM